jgi:uncharacterized protein with FMN-binding domain
MLKKVLVILGIVFFVIVIGFGILMYRLTNMAQTIESELNKVTGINLTKVADGVYAGSFGDFVVFSSVEVVVKDHRIDKIVITDQKCAQGYEAKDTVDRIIQTQSPKVDAVTGASSSSRTIMIAVDRALRQGIK